MSLIISGLALAPSGDCDHVPAAWMSLFIYVVMAVSASVGLIWQIRLADMIATASAPIGAAFAFIALVTGSLWGKPMWGAYWVWDARLTSELILLFLYFGYMALQSAIEDQRTADKASGLLAIVGVVNIPRYKPQPVNAMALIANHGINFPAIP